MNRSPADNPRIEAPGATPRYVPPLANPLPAATEATNVPWPRSRSVSGRPSTVRGYVKPIPAPRAVPRRTLPTTLLPNGRSGCVASTPVSRTAMVTPAPDRGPTNGTLRNGSASTSSRPMSARLSASKNDRVRLANTERTAGRAAMRTI